MRKKVLVAVAILFALLILLPVVNLFSAPTNTALASAAASADPAAPEVGRILEAGCAHCHVSGVAPPLYASLPLASAVVRADVEEGLDALEFTQGLFPAGAAATQPALAKLEFSIESGAMPPARYLALHWNGGLDEGEEGKVLAWIRGLRVSLHAPPGLPVEVAGGVVHPVPASLPVDAGKAALGSKLYHDVRLSGDDTVSCATCHDLSKGGTDQAPVSTGVRGQKGGINAPTTFNAAFHFLQFWDGRAADLQAQAGGPPLNPVEMDGNWEAICAKLAKDEALSREFVAVYPEGFSADTITDAIAEFERTLVTPDSPFDRFLSGDASALTEEERRGWDLFRGTGCATCHCGAVLGGRSFELMGRKADYFGERGNPTEADAGRFNVTGEEADRHRFKVPSLRNITLTFPYFHDASAEDLGEAVAVMARVQNGVELEAGDRDAVVKFLGTLTGKWEGKDL